MTRFMISHCTTFLFIQRIRSFFRSTYKLNIDVIKCKLYYECMCTKILVKIEKNEISVTRLCHFLPTDRSTAYSKSLSVTFFLLSRAAWSAASLHTFAISAPEKPGVMIAKLNWIYFISTYFEFQTFYWKFTDAYKSMAHFPM